jgi:hypothetical protein
MKITDDIVGVAIEMVVAAVILGFGFLEIVPAILSA